MGRNIVISNTGGSFVFRRNAHVGGLMKSETARRGDLVVMKAVRLEQVGRSDMTPEEKFLAGGAFLALIPRPVEVYVSESTRRAIREALIVKSADLCAMLDAGTANEEDLVKAIGAVERDGGGAQDYEDRDAEGNAVLGEPLRKSPDAGLFDLRRRDGREIVEGAYAAYLKKGQDGASALAEAARELDALVARLGR